MAKALMLQGTGSDVGKTMLVAGLCRAAANRGLRVAPFKPQNMSNNAAIAQEGGEIGRGQALQAFAARLVPSVHMNPILLKPQSDSRAQLIVQGQVSGAAGGADYQRHKQRLLEKALESYRLLAAEHDYILAEGAGSPAEINLRRGDIVNMGFAEAADMPVLLAGDIDRGGVIAALAGTHLVLSAADKARIKGYIINKFRGRQELFAQGIAAIGEFTGWRCFGIVPWLAEAALLPAEDSLALSYPPKRPSCGAADSAAPGKIRIIVPLAAHIANFDDFDPLRHEPNVELRFIRCGETLPEADIIILGGSKAVLADMEEFNRCGLSAAIRRFAGRGGRVVGLCGGLQMLGAKLRDPHGLEGKAGEAEGLGLLEMETALEKEKILGERAAQSRFFGVTLRGYEIHCGRSFGPACANPPFLLEGKAEGAASADRRIWGTYLHGIFHNGAFRARFLRALLPQSAVFGGLPAAAASENYEAKLDKALDKIAAQLEQALNIDEIFGLMR